MRRGPVHGSRARIEFDPDTKIDDCDSFDENRDSEMYSEGPAGDAEYAIAMAARKAWLNDEWSYCGVVLSIERAGVVLDKHAASLWGIECNYPGSTNEYLTAVAFELLDEAIRTGEGMLAILCENEPRELDPLALLDAIVECLDGREWSADTCDAIAQRLRDAGYLIREPA